MQRVVDYPPMGKYDHVLKKHGLPAANGNGAAANGNAAKPAASGLAGAIAESEEVLLVCLPDDALTSRLTLNISVPDMKARMLRNKAAREALNDPQ